MRGRLSKLSGNLSKYRIPEMIHSSGRARNLKFSASTTLPLTLTLCTFLLYRLGGPWFLPTHTHIYMYIYIYIYAFMCVWVCVLEWVCACVCNKGRSKYNIWPPCMKYCYVCSLLMVEWFTRKNNRCSYSVFNWYWSFSRIKKFVKSIRSDFCIKRDEWTWNIIIPHYQIDNIKQCEIP